MGYESSRLLAQRLMAKKGRLDGVLRRPSADAQPTAGKPWSPADPTPSYDPVVAEGFAVVVLDASLFKKDQLAPEATAVAYAAADDLPEPRVGDLLETKGERFAVLDVQDLSPGSDSILYTLMLKA
jgi:hypothetical protein